MTVLTRAIAFFLLTVTAGVAAHGRPGRPGPRPGGPPPESWCSPARRSQRKPWQTLTDPQRDDYIRASLCLAEMPARHGIEGAKTLWDELHYAHIAQSAFIHFVGGFLPWHRYFLVAHETLLRGDCGYQGPMPYWDQTNDVSNLRGAAVFDPISGFGGDGVGPDLCIGDGPFVNLTLRFNEDLAFDEPYCLVRNMSECLFQGAAPSFVNDCLGAETYVDAWACLEKSPHISGHWGVGGTMSNTLLSPGDPIFFLHHGWLDRLWWEWQSKDLATRLTEVDGPNIIPTNATGPPPGQRRRRGMDWLRRRGGPPDDSTCPGTPLGGGPGAGLAHGGGTKNKAITDYFNDGGGILTTLNHTLWSAGIIPNATIAEVMDLHGPLVCADYV
ncbi:amino acid transporter [Podospora didyma]|uniref:Amino acid transporter n=1 Tax=Podospora didyma TaxID=330526 RepID=A0AAE0NZP2_9PEZI|nr:amino acid transporter [Podospora didyma]